ncbi:MAG: ribosomal L7Ae/L30e/S12e/Gadd45 family protein [candidate division Zixibacteria bacterium]|nr:ribosomal L7Ae/L30e/S12e/Gadd45 family protein [candidate division Zixibacteria bacterium]
MKRVRETQDGVSNGELRPVISDSILGLIGLAFRARQVRAGASATRALIRSGKARLVVVAKDSSENTKRLFTYLARQQAIPIVEGHTCEEFGVCFDGAPKAVVTIIDAHFADGILKKAGIRSPRNGRTHQGEA